MRSILFVRSTDFEPLTEVPDQLKTQRLPEFCQQSHGPIQTVYVGELERTGLGLYSVQMGGIGYWDHSELQNHRLLRR